MRVDYHISELVPYVNWAYFYFAWQLRDADAQQRARQEAEVMLRELEDQYKVHALLRLMHAHSEGDDIVVTPEKGDGGAAGRLSCLRQQEATSEFLCLADFISPAGSDEQACTSRIGLFATSVDRGMECDFDADPYQKMMAQLLADRLAEAAAERLHEQVRKTLWGYAPDEHLTIDELHQERFQGIRPAVGYPSLPDASINFELDRLLDFGEIGIRLTESGAMRPHASVSGLMMAHPDAHYFPVGKIGADQLADYAHRRSIPITMARKFLAANL